MDESSIEIRNHYKPDVSDVERITVVIFVASPEYLILHRGECACATGGYAPDRLFADNECGLCDEPFGYGVPIVVDEGRASHHLSCEVERDGA